MNNILTRLGLEPRTHNYCAKALPTTPQKVLNELPTLQLNCYTRNERILSECHSQKGREI
ncbi:hypothetical protein SK128_007543 [Halocaridina rubra]|uniref:Uncharacterized protein n=1 Tax=Halocaridina rubra TaxID=373956 RepID=A0AAN8WG37_HALRR